MTMERNTGARPTEQPRPTQVISNPEARTRTSRYVYPEEKLQAGQAVPTLILDTTQDTRERVLITRLGNTERSYKLEPHQGFLFTTLLFLGARPGQEIPAAELDKVSLAGNNYGVRPNKIAELLRNKLGIEDASLGLISDTRTGRQISSYTLNANVEIVERGVITKLPATKGPGERTRRPRQPREQGPTEEDRPTFQALRMMVDSPAAVTRMELVRAMNISVEERSDPHLSTTISERVRAEMINIGNRVRDNKATDEERRVWNSLAGHCDLEPIDYADIMGMARYKIDTTIRAHFNTTLSHQKLSDFYRFITTPDQSMAEYLAVINREHTPPLNRLTLHDYLMRIAADMATQATAYLQWGKINADPDLDTRATNFDLRWPELATEMGFDAKDPLNVKPIKEAFERKIIERTLTF